MGVLAATSDVAVVAQLKRSNLSRNFFLPYYLLTLDLKFSRGLICVANSYRASLTILHECASSACLGFVSALTLKSDD